MHVYARADDVCVYERLLIVSLVYGIVYVVGESVVYVRGRIGVMREDCCLNKKSVRP